MPSEAALCAKAIRKDLKENFKGTKFRVTSENHHTCTRVAIEWEGASPSTNEVHDVVYKYQTYRECDALDNPTYVFNDSIPQVDFISLHNRLKN